MNVLDGANGAQNGHSGVHHHNGNIDKLDDGVLWIAHFEERQHWKDEVQGCEPNGATERNEVSEEGNGSCNEGDDHTVHCGHHQSHQAVVQAQGRLVVVHHLLLNKKVRWAAINLDTCTQT